jgi:Mn-dependent DtxR family transcriptional regulator
MYPMKGACRLRTTNSRDDYLEAILLLSQASKRSDGAIRTPQVARHLNYSLSATYNAVERLEKHGLVRFDKPKLIYLTEEGYDIAIAVHEKHIFFKAALTQLGMDSDAAEHAACEIEHGVDAEVFELLKKRWSEYMGRPCGKLGFCPRERSDGAK